MKTRMQAMIARVTGGIRGVEGKSKQSNRTHVSSKEILAYLSKKSDGKSHLCCFKKESKDLEKEVRSRKQPPMAGSVIWVAVSPAVRKWG